MPQNPQNDVFNYSYCADSRREIEQIRKKYLPAEEDKLERLRRLDASVTRKGSICSLILGIIGALIMGGGMSLVMVWNNLVFGIPLGVIGLILAVLAYPLYSHLVRIEKEKIAPEILALTEELMK